MSDGPTPRLLREWENRVRAEYASAAAFAQITHLAVVCGIPPELVRVGTRIVNDELDHASLSHDALVALGGGGAPTALDVGALEWPRSVFLAELRRLRGESRTRRGPWTFDADFEVSTGS